MNESWHLSDLTEAELIAEIELLRTISDQNVVAGVVQSIFQNELERRKEHEGKD